MFTGGKVFTRSAFFNPKDEVIWADNQCNANKSGVIHERAKYPVSVMVALGAIWNELMELFFEKDERLNGTMYCENLLSFYKEGGDRLFSHPN
jgi:hypothetical protein